MTARERLQRLRIGALDLNRRVGANMLRGLVVSVFLHSAIVSVWYTISSLTEGPTTGNVGPTPPTVLDLRDFNRDLEPTPRFKRPSRPVLPDVTIPVAVEEEILELEDSLEIEPLDDLLTGAIGETDVGGGMDSGAGLGSHDGSARVSNEAGLVKPWEKWIPREIEPVPLSTNPQPGYPALARRAGVEASVYVWVHVDEQGVVTDWNIVHITVSGLGFEEEVARIISRWRFTPAIQGNDPVAVWVNIPFRFRIER